MTRKSRGSIEIPKIKGKDSLYRYIGIIGSTATFIQSIIWIVLCLTALIFFCTGGSVDANDTNPYLASYTLNLAKLYFNSNTKYSQSFLTPGAVCLLICVYLISSVNLVLASAYIFNVFRKWNKTKKIAKAAPYWSISAIIMFGIEFFTFLLFFIDYLKISTYDGALSAAPATIMTIAAKGWLMSFFCLTPAVLLIYLHFCVRSRPI